MSGWIETQQLPSSAQISHERGSKYAEEIGAVFMETSALNATNVEEIFMLLSK